MKSDFKIQYFFIKLTKDQPKHKLTAIFKLYNCSRNYLPFGNPQLLHCNKLFHSFMVKQLKQQ